MKKSLKALIVTGVLMGILVFGDQLSAYGFDMPSSFKWFVVLCVNSMLWVGLLLIPQILFGKRSRLFYVPFFLIAEFLILIEWYVRINFGMNIAGEWIGILLSSSASEVREFITGVATPMFVIASALSLTGAVFAVRLLWRQSCSGMGRAGVGLSLLIGACFVGWHPKIVNDPLSVVLASPAFDLLYDTFSQGEHYAKLNRMKDAPKLPSGLTLRPAAGAKPLFAVFVIGESATRNRWSLYGYGKPTTPRMDGIRDELCVFTDFIGSTPRTESTLRVLLTEATVAAPLDLNCNMSQILRAAGFRCVLFSSHERWGKWDGVEPFYFCGCDEIRFMSEENLPSPWYDDSLLPYLDREIAKADGKPTVVFLHLRGSHVFSGTQYPAGFRPFEPERIEHWRDRGNPSLTSNHYDNSIAFTDKVLGDVVERLRAMGRPTMMLYLSDHGESVDTPHWRDERDVNVWELPLVCWFSPLYRKAYPTTVGATFAARNRPLQMERLLPGLVSLVQVVGYGRPEDDFHDASFACKAKRKIRNGKVDYDP